VKLPTLMDQTVVRRARGVLRARAIRTLLAAAVLLGAFASPIPAEAAPKGKDKRVQGLIIASLSFFLFLTLEVKSLNPITPAESFINRYFSAVLGPVFIVLAYAAEGLVLRLAPKAGTALALRPKFFFVGVLVFGLAAVLALFSLPRLPSGIRGYANSPLHLERHPLALNEGYRERINSAYREGTPIVAVSGLAGSNAILTCVYYYLDIDTYSGGRPPMPVEARSGDTPCLLLSRSGEIGAAKNCLAALRTPFRLVPMGTEDIAKLSDTAGDDEE